ncbi:hypothetical protein P4O66_003920 [Electrophorus voltai]|uniref:DUF6729 domain-containing protein n=1 Tax=Electrophorus voltai TaxID=2609070 RepID=A0AAD9E1X7_9TELE|nr:hypothetical protein P4O66_003920 [Electrophorus voltai]
MRVRRWRDFDVPCHGEQGCPGPVREPLPGRDKSRRGAPDHGRVLLSWAGGPLSRRLRGTPERKDREKRSYIQWIWRQKVRPGSKREALQKYIQRTDAKESGRVSSRQSSIAISSALEGSSARLASEGSCVRLRAVEVTRLETAQEPSDADLLAVSMELDTEAPSSSAPEVPAPPQRSLPTAEPEKQPVPTADVLLPEGWKQTLPREQHQWVSRALFTREQSGRPVLPKNLCLWWSTPGPWLVYAQPPSSPDAFFHSRMFLWMPYRVYAFKLLCAQPSAVGWAISCGLYRTVLDFSGWYFMATQQLPCSTSGTSWSSGWTCGTSCDGSLQVSPRTVTSCTASSWATSASASNQLSEQLLRLQLVEDYTRPGEYSGELIGMEYLYSQTGVVLHEDLGRDPDTPDGLSDEDLPELEDKGFKDVDMEFDEFADPTCSEHSLAPLPPLHRTAVGPHSPAASPRTWPSPLKAWDLMVLQDTITVNLANSLVDLRHQAFVPKQRVDSIVALWDKLPDVQIQSACVCSVVCLTPAETAPEETPGPQPPIFISSEGEDEGHLPFLSLPESSQHQCEVLREDEGEESEDESNDDDDDDDD